jgi:hypothetical protein
MGRGVERDAWSSPRCPCPSAWSTGGSATTPSDTLGFAPGVACTAGGSDSLPGTPEAGNTASTIPAVPASTAIAIAGTHQGIHSGVLACLCPTGRSRGS